MYFVIKLLYNIHKYIRVKKVNKYLTRWLRKAFRHCFQKYDSKMAPWTPITNIFLALFGLKMPFLMLVSVTNDDEYTRHS